MNDKIKEGYVVTFEANDDIQEYFSNFLDAEEWARKMEWELKVDFDIKDKYKIFKVEEC
jgi:hypothetical protein